MQLTQVMQDTYDLNWKETFGCTLRKLVGARRGGDILALKNHRLFPLRHCCITILFPMSRQAPLRFFPMWRSMTRSDIWTTSATSNLQKEIKEWLCWCIWALKSYWMFTTVFFYPFSSSWNQLVLLHCFLPVTLPFSLLFSFGARKLSQLLRHLEEWYPNECSSTWISGICLLPQKLWFQC